MKPSASHEVTTTRIGRPSGKTRAGVSSWTSSETSFSSGVLPAVDDSGLAARSAAYGSNALFRRSTMTSKGFFSNLAQVYATFGRLMSFAQSPFLLLVRL